MVVLFAIKEVHSVNESKSMNRILYVYKLICFAYKSSVDGYKQAHG
mgnify:CR=1 FL=1